jgi:hypothetical protein
LSSKKKQKGKEKKGSKQSISPAVLDKIMLGAFALFLILITTYKIQGDDDIFWHLASGRYIAETKTVPSADVFGFVTNGEHWIPFEWGWDLLTFTVYKIGGFVLLSILRTLIFLLIFFLYYRILKKFNVSNTIFILSGIILVFGLFERLTPRPQVISYMFFALILYIIIDQRYFGRGNFKPLFFIPLIFLLWSNMHMGMLSGIALFLIYFISETLVYFYPKKFSDGDSSPLSKNNLLMLLLILIVTLLIPLINPHGFATYSYTISHLQMNVMSQTNEWLSPFNELFIGRLNNVIYILFLIGAIPVLYYSYKKKDIFITVLTIIFALYSTRSVRFSTDYQVIIFVFFVLAIDYLVSRIRDGKMKSFLLQKSPLKIVFSLLLVILIVTAANDKLYYALRYIRATGFGIDNYFYPVKMFEFIKENKIQDIGERPFNSYESGGYFIWTFQGKKDFVDSRGLNDRIVDEYKSIEMKGNGFAQKLAEYGIDYIPWCYADIVMTPQYLQMAIVSYLASKPDEWKLIYWDDNSFLFVRNAEKFKNIISKYEYRFVNPYNFIFQRKVIDDALQDNHETVKKEIRRKLNEEPSGNFIRAIYSAYYTKINR